MSTNPYRAAYLESKVLSASPLELVHVAYEAAIEAIQTARLRLQEKDIVGRSRAITKAQLIILELVGSLDFEKGGELTPQLARLYEYMQRRLLEANAQQKEEPLAEVESLLETMDEAWRNLAAAERSEIPPAASASWMSNKETSVYGHAEFTY
jgi:flagellar protein FliS